MATLLAYGVTPEGKKTMLGASVSLSEAEVHWQEFLLGLQSRGMRGVRLIVSDDHAGLKKARRSVFPSIPWQRCQFHLCQNAQSYAPKKSMRGEIAKVIRDILQSPTIEISRELKRQAIEKYEKKGPVFRNNRPI